MNSRVWFRVVTLASLVGCGVGPGLGDGGNAVADGGSGGPLIGACPSVGLEGARVAIPSCVAALPSSGLGGAIVAGTYRLTGYQLTPEYYSDAGTGVCTPNSPSSLQAAVRLRFAPTATPARYDYEAVRGFVLPDGGTLVQPGAERGVATISADGLSVSFGGVTCGDAGVAVLSTDVPRVFRATGTSFSLDCCRTTVPDAGGSGLSSPSGYMIDFTRE